jgi:hypothetical protein
MLRGLREPYGLAQRMALIRYYFHEVPETATQFARSWNDLYFALQFDGKLKVQTIKKG